MESNFAKYTASPKIPSTNFVFHTCGGKMTKIERAIWYLDVALAEKKNVGP